jgi:c-di-GMP-binding flagellar brake protein YcgR
VGKSVDERRKHKRHRVSVVIALQRPASAEPLKSKTLDVSDGGAMLTIPIKNVPKLSERVRVLLSLPRSTANTYMVEEVACDARVVRHQPMEADDVVGIALQFSATQNLGLEV